MNRPGHTLCIVALTLSLALASSGAPLAAPPQPFVQALNGMPPRVFLRLDPVSSTFHLPPRDLPPGLRAQSANITVTYLAAGSYDEFGTYCYAWPAQAQAAFEYAVSIWESLINSNVEIKVNACWADLEADTLGYSAADNYYRDFTNAPQANTWYASALANALRGVDLNASAPDMHVTYNQGFSWYYGVDGNTPPNQMDLVSVVLHEVCHGLGFGGSMVVSGGLGYWGFGISSYPEAYDRYTERGSGTALLSYTNGSAALASALTSQDVYFDGPYAVAANGGARVKLYAPATWLEGSSYVHLDEIYNNTLNALMTYSLAYGESVHDTGDIALGILHDVGWAPANPPTVTSITPNSGYNTGTVTITNLAGTNLAAGATVRLTRSGQADIAGQDVHVVSSAQITCTLNLSGAAPGSWSVVVTNPDDQSGTLTNGFTVLTPAAIAVTSITPASGFNTGTVHITNLAGSGFAPGATAKLSRNGYADINAANVVVASAAQITCDLNLAGAAPGQWNVVVTNLDTGSASLANGFTVTAPAAVAVTSIAPATGVNTSTVHITNLVGSGFASGATVKLNRSGYSDIVATNVVVVSAAQITCDLDLTGATPGPWNVVVTNLDTGSASLANGFTVTAPPGAPSVSGIAPASGLNTGTVHVTNLAGSNFVPGATVKLNRSGYSDIVATNVVVVSPSQIACDLNLAGSALGKWNVVVTNPDAQSGQLDNAFTVQVAVYLPMAADR